MKLGVCVPYRNREAHLEQFIPRVSQYLENRGIEFCMYFGHQKDDKLFNRGATKNIAAKAAFEDGCDYIVWHDIDMIPEEGGGADYGVPSEKGPVHIATKISQMNYELKYFEYFGGAVLFTKDQVERTNGYSNEYWDWGMEDDDLFWRSYREGLVNEEIFRTISQGKYMHFTGDNSWAKIPIEDTDLRGVINRSHTLSIICRAFQQPEKNQIYLIGDKNRKYVEYPILIVPGYDYGIQFNNSKAFSMQTWNTFNQNNYMWLKRYDQQWSILTFTFDVDSRIARMYLNGREVDSTIGEGSPSPVQWTGRLRNYGPHAFYLGTTPSVAKEDPRRYFKGDIREICLFDRALSPEEVKTLALEGPSKVGYTAWHVEGDDSDWEMNTFGLEVKEEDIVIPNSIKPWRKEGRFTCLPHEDEGIVNGGFKKENTKNNERRYQLEMQQGKIDYKQDGYNNILSKCTVHSVEEIAPRAKMINVSF